MEKIRKTDKEWRTILTEQQFNVLRKGATEKPGTGEYYHFSQEGIYLCAACGNQLFASEHKYNSGSGWPSFDKPSMKTSVEERSDSSHGMQRVEIICARCDSHLGHVFEDGPATTGLRYCVNSAALKFSPKE